MTETQFVHHFADSFLNSLLLFPFAYFAILSRGMLYFEMTWKRAICLLHRICETK